MLINDIISNVRASVDVFCWQKLILEPCRAF